MTHSYHYFPKVFAKPLDGVLIFLVCNFAPFSHLSVVFVMQFHFANIHVYYLRYLIDLILALLVRHLFRVPSLLAFYF